jgi:hypothetical protein
VPITDPAATREWVEEVALWDRERLERHRFNRWPRNDAACLGRSGVPCSYLPSCQLTAEAEGEARYIRWADDGLPSNRKEIRDGRGQGKGKRAP